MNPKWDLMSLHEAIKKGLVRHQPDSKHAPGRDSATAKYRAERNRKNRAARAMRKVQRRLDKQSGKRQRSGRKR